MKENKQQNIKLGLFVVIALVFFIGGIYLLGRQQNLFSSSIKVSAVFKNVNGLQEGNNVRFSGINIGTVSGIEIVGDSNVRVKMLLDKEVQPFIKKNSKVSIGTEGLMGNKMITISSGTAEAGGIDNKQTLEAVEPANMEDVLKNLNKVAENATIISDDLAQITSNITKGAGTEDLLENLKITAENSAAITKNLAEITEKINSGKGTLGQLLTDKELIRDLNIAVDNIKEGSQTFNSNIKALENAPIIGKLIEKGKERNEE